MMEKVAKYSNTTIASKLNGKYVKFTSDCSLFPNFKVTGRVISTTYAKHSSNLLFILKTDSGKTITVDSKMHNLQFEFV